MKKGSKMSKEQKIKISSSRLGIIPSEETRHKMSVVKVGKSTWNKGKHTGNSGNGFKRGQTSWNKDKTMPDSMREKMKGNTNGQGNKNRIYSKETRDKMSQAQYRRRFRENPDYVPDGGSERRVLLLKQNGGFHSKGEWENLFAQYNWTCLACHRSKPEIQLTKDHIIPASKGGSNNIENIQPLCKSCNSKKNNKTIKY